MMSVPGVMSTRALAAAAAAVLAFGVSAGEGRATGPRVSNPNGEAFSLIFDSEWIWLDVVGDSLQVRGTYVLLCRRPTTEAIPLYFPLPEDPLLGGARMVSLAFRAGGASASTPARWEEVPGAAGVRWWIPPCPGDSVIAEAVYRQKITTGYARYIVTTARGWGRPLRYAAFEIRLPPGAEPESFSYPFARRDSQGDTYWFYETDEFFPDRDIVIRWRR
jgi:hypothetical protein